VRLLVRFQPASAEVVPECRQNVIMERGLRKQEQQANRYVANEILSAALIHM
jgi:hypothetical protein